MDHNYLVLVILAAVFGSITFKNWMKFQQRKFEILQSRPIVRVDDTTMSELRNEIARVSDTATLYDMSIQHTLDEILRRLEYLESQRSSDTVGVGRYAASETTGQTGVVQTLMSGS